MNTVDIIAVGVMCGVILFIGWSSRIAWEGLQAIRKRDAEYEKAKRRFAEQLERVSTNLRKTVRGD